jgi:hypothetical protein
VEERRVYGVDERQAEESLVSAVGLDEERPGMELAGASGEVWLEGKEGWVGVVRWEGEGGRGRLLLLLWLLN